MTEIDKYLKHLVDINHVTYSEGSRTITTTENVPAFITERRSIRKDEAGDHEESQTVVYLKATQTITRQDEVVIDDSARPVKDLRRARNLKGIRYLRVVVS